MEKHIIFSRLPCFSNNKDNNSQNDSPFVIFCPPSSNARLAVTDERETDDRAKNKTTQTRNFLCA
jgi:hypothetical protein